MASSASSGNQVLRESKASADGGTQSAPQVLPEVGLLSFKRDCLIVIVILFFTIGTIIITLVLGAPLHFALKKRYANMSFVRSLIKPHEFRRASVAVDAPWCASIGNQLLRRGGSAVDAALGTLLCVTVVHPHTAGFGGGVQLLVYQNRKKQIFGFDGLPVQTKANYRVYANASRASSIGIPGTLSAMWRVHQQFGKMEWHALFEPAIQLCKSMLPISSHLGGFIRLRFEEIQREATASRMFLRNRTGEPLQEGDAFQCTPQLLQTLMNLSTLRDSVDDFYGGSIAKNIIRDLSPRGIAFHESDFGNYATKTPSPLTIQLSQQQSTIHTMPSDAGIHLSLIMKAMDKFYLTQDTSDDLTSMVNFIRHFVEVSKLVDTPSSRFENMDDPNKHRPKWKTANDHFFINTPNALSTASHVTVLAPNGDVVALTATLCSPFGSLLYSLSTGIVFNDCFREETMSISASPVVVTDSFQDILMVVGATDGTMVSINSVIAQAIIYYIYEKRTLFDASIGTKCFADNQIEAEGFRIVCDETVFPSVLHELEAIGYLTAVQNISVALTLFGRADGAPEIVLSNNKPGSTDGF